MNSLDGGTENDYRDIIWWDGKGELEVYVVICENTCRLFRELEDAIDFSCPFCAIAHIGDL
jgi:hypothetical protein